MRQLRAFFELRELGPCYWVTHHGPAWPGERRARREHDPVQLLTGPIPRQCRLYSRFARLKQRAAARVRGRATGRGGPCGVRQSWRRR
jgi:hypothetical protein